MSKSQWLYTCHSMMQGSNENIKEKIGIVLFSDYLGITPKSHYTTDVHFSCVTVEGKVFDSVVDAFLAFVATFLLSWSTILE